MWASLALMTALNGVPAQSGQMEIKNARVTHGILGQERKDTTYLPGDMVVLAFDVEGLAVGGDGLIRYGMSVELTNKEGKQQFKKDPQETVTVNTLGGTRLPSFALTNIGTDTTPGEYTMTVVVTDLGNKNKPSAKKDLKFEVKPLQFGIVRPGFTYVDMSDQGGGRPQLAPPVAVPGQNLQLNFAVVGFELKGDKQEPNIEVKMEVNDEGGKAVVKPFTGSSTSLPDELKKLKVNPFFFHIQANRSGKFKVVLTATDKNSGKTATQTLDLKVVEVE
jgi:hypothetical protein